MSSNSFSWADLKQAADDAGFTVLPVLKDVGAEVATAEHKKTSTGKDQISARFKLTEGPYAGKSVFNNFVLTLDNGAALGFFFRDMAKFGLTDEYFATNPPLAAVAAALVGRPCRLDVGIRKWNGEERNEVNAVRPPSGGVTPVPASTPGAGYGVPTPSVPTPGISTPSIPAPAYPTTVDQLPTPTLPGIPPVTVSEPTNAPAAPPLPF